MLFLLIIDNIFNSFIFFYINQIILINCIKPTSLMINKNTKDVLHNSNQIVMEPPLYFA
jgi:hypothetical protein